MDKYLANRAHQIGYSAQEDSDEGNLEVSSGDEGPDLTERLSQYPGTAGRADGERSTIGDRLSLRNGAIDPNTLGAKDLPDIFDDKKHKMTFTF